MILDGGHQPPVHVSCSFHYPPCLKEPKPGVEALWRIDFFPWLFLLSVYEYSSIGKHRMSSSTFYHKPELALRRALELEGIHQNEAALALLHDVLSNRRQRTWSPAYEQIMVSYLDLCLKLHNDREAKDGLHQYRNLAQSQAPGSLEKVIRYLLDRAEDKCSKAKAAADAASQVDESTSVNNILSVDGEDDAGNAQALMLSSVSTDPAKNQRESQLVLPSLKFLWEIYRAVLDILKSNSKLEHVYHSTAIGALRFCQTYQRRNEFRRLSDMLRMHLGNLQKYGDDSGKGNNKVRGWEGWTTEAVELHLQTRFAQLETASILHLYTEGIRTVEDIYNILQISHQRRKQNPDIPPPKAKLMAKYYEQLTSLFWVSEDHLFHALAWYKFYGLCIEFNKGMSEELKQEQASAVLLATLCIPSLPKGSSDADQLADSMVQEKMARMATLLGFHTRNPTRENLVEEITSRGIFEQVPSYLQDLFYLLERDSDPLVLVETAKPLLETLAEKDGSDGTSDFARYVQPLRNVLLLKLLWNLSAAYHTVRIDFLRKLTAGLGMTFEQVEKCIVLFTQTHKGLAVRLDHRSGCLQFGDAQLESDNMRSQLTVLAQQLDKVCQTIAPESTEAKDQARAQMYDTIRETRAADHSKMLERKAWIEQRKEEIERLAQDKVRQEAEKAAAEEAARKKEEELRIKREQQLREQEKQRKIQQEIDNTKKEKLLKAMGHNVEALSNEELTALDTAALEKEHQEKINKKKEEAERKTKEAAKQLDYLVRAIRIEELPLIKAKYEESTKNEKEQYEKDVLEKAKRLKAQWESDKQDKERLSAFAVFKHMDEFQAKVMEGRQLAHVVACREADKDAELEAEKQKMKRARKRKDAELKRQAEEAERLKKEEEERKAAEERAKKEAALRERQQQEEERKKAELARMAKEREEKDKQTSAAGRSASGLDQARGGGGGKYVPPSRRGRGGGSGYDGPSRLDARGSGFGGGKYDGRRGPGDRQGGGGNRGGDDRRGGGYGDDRRGGYDRRPGGYGGRREGGSGGQRW
eukprot:Nitzschia sp. Nitz4//scaffold124_size66437//46855//50047//NITZ4_006117-RA/size66437-snap-gene-0.23-mRNA-1//1//CDS//3329534570//7704//frame0